MSKKVKIFRIITKLNIGGSSIHSVLLTAHLDKDLYQSILIRGNQEKEGGTLDDLIHSKGVKPLVIPEMVREISPIKDLIASWKLYRLMKIEKPEIVHTHSSKAGTLGRLAAKIAGVPLIIHTFHGHVFKGYFGNLKSKIFIIVERLLALITTKIITVCPAQRKEILNFKIANSNKIIFIYLGLELTPFLSCNHYKGELRKELGIQDSSPVVGVVARLVRVKGIDYFLRAVKEVSKHKPRVKFLIVGDGELRFELENLVRKLGIEENVLFLGFRRDLVKIYADLDLVVLSSLNEGLPVSIIEAMASGKPVIATDVGGVKNLIQNEINGILIPPEDVNSLAKAMVYLLENPGLRTKMGQISKEKAYPFFNYTRLIKDVNVLYGTLIRSKHLSRN
jgi:glycosyltransferase involved in cell wall biosynthesis